MSNNQRSLEWVFAILMGALLMFVFLKATGIRGDFRKDFSLAEFSGIVLSALSVMVGILTFFLAVLAIFGWTAFRTIIEEKSEEIFKKRFDASNPEYKAMIDQLVADTRAEIAKRQQAEEYAEENNPARDEDQE